MSKVVDLPMSSHTFANLLTKPNNLVHDFRLGVGDRNSGHG
jgi:hypothetical protein